LLEAVAAGQARGMLEEMVMQVAARWREVLEAGVGAGAPGEVVVTLACEQVLAGVPSAAVVRVVNRGRTAALNISVDLGAGEAAVRCVPPGGDVELAAPVPVMEPGPVELSGEITFDSQRCRRGGCAATPIPM